MNQPLPQQNTPFFTRIFGQLSWIAPAWILNLKQIYQRMVWWFWLLVLMLGASMAAICYYQQLPKPLQVIANIKQPELTADKKNARPDNLLIAFEYDLKSLNANQAHPEGKPSVARIDLLKQPLVSGIKLKPAFAGRWTWKDDRHLLFTPDKDWPAGVEYSVHLDKTLFSDNTLLADDTYRFTTLAFTSKLDDLKFYQNPQDAAIKQVVATLSFSHPVEPETLKKHINLSMRPSGASVNELPESYDFTLNYSKNKRKAYLHSQALQLPPHSNYMQLQLEEGVKSSLGGLTSKQALAKKVMIPDAGSFLQIDHSSTHIINNAQGEPEQVLRLVFTDAIKAEELSSKLQAYLLPTYKNGNNKRWSSVQAINDQVLSRSEKIPLVLIPNPRESSRTYHFRYDAPQGRYLYINIAPQLQSVNGYYRKAFYDQVLIAPTYPKQVKIMGEGATLYRSGEHKLSLLARGVDHLKISIGKIKPEQMYHLISQTRGDISQPYFYDSYHFSEKNLAEFKQDIISLAKTHPKTANYASFDLSRYLTDNGGKFGLFMITRKAWDVRHQREIRSDDDKRLILVTDLGLLVKNNADGSHEIFVQSLLNGKPVQGANIQLLGVNGQPVLKGKTDNEGHLHLPTTNDYKNEQRPTVYLVSTDEDTAFIPFKRAARQIQYSSFDIGGMTSSVDKADQLSAFVFSDRGIYRPGEMAKLGGIVRQGYSAPFDAIPLEIVIRGPRSTEVKSKKFMLPEQGFLEHEFATNKSSDTGQYEAALYLITDKGRRGNLVGSTTFRVEEFQPDTLKMESRIIGAEHSGWVTAPELQANIKLQNLFGTAAQNRKISAKMQVHPTRFQFKAYSDYNFYTPVNSKVNSIQINETLADTQTDAQGLASYQLDLQRFAQGNYVLNFQAEGFDAAGGRSVSAHNRVLISPLTYQVAYKADGALDYIHHKAQRSIELIAINPQLERIEKTGLSRQLKQIRQLSTLVKQDNGTYKYQTVASEKIIDNKPFSISKQGDKLLLPTVSAGEFVLEIIEQTGNIVNRIPFTVVGQGNLTANLEKNSLLKLKLNRKDYKAGDLIEMNITAPYHGAGLISIESDKVHAYKWFTSDSQSSIQSIRIPDGLEGNAYVNVAFIRSQHSKEIYSSPLSYAVQPFSIDRRQRVIDVQLEVPEKVVPGEILQIAYQTSHPSKMLVFAVDEGILQVVDYQTPAPLDHFLRKRALSVSSLQTLDLILPEFSQLQTLSQLSAPGGGDEAEKKALAKNLNPFQRKTDKPAVFWSGIVEADITQQFTRFTVPDSFAGSLRVMAVAVSDEAMGVGRRNTLVRGPFVISPNLLTQAAPGDEFTLTVGIANNIEQSGIDAPVSIAIETSEHLQVMGDAKQELKISENSEGQVIYQLKVNKQPGAASVKMIASSQGTSGIVSGERTASLSIRPATPYYSSFSSGFAEDGTLQQAIKRKLFSNLAQQKVAASTSPLVLVEGLSSYLQHFPHGCTEQVVSQLFPALGLLNYPAFADDKHKQTDKFAVLMDTLGSRQLSDGGFSFWPGSSKVNEYPSIYALHFLTEAKALGIAVPKRLLQRGTQFLKRYAAQQTSTLTEARARANAIYLLTRSGQVTTNDLVQLQTSLQKSYPKLWQSDLAAVYLAATYQLLHKGKEAQQLIQHYVMGKGASPYDDDFHTPLARDAQYLFLLAKHFPALLDVVDAEQINTLITPIYRGEYNTISAAYSVLALGAYSQQQLLRQGEAQPGFSVIKTDGSKAQLSTLDKPFPHAEFAAGVEPEITQINIAAQQAVFYLISQSGFDLHVAQQASSHGLEIHRAYLDEEGKEVTAYQVGKELTVRIRIRALDDEYLNNIAVIDLLPGGFEVVSISIANPALQRDTEYIDVREDRVVIYQGVSSSITELSYQVKVTAAGRFIIPPVFAESMYDRAIYANGAATVFNVSQP